MVLFGPVVEPLRGGALLKEVGGWGWALGLYDNSSLAAHSAS